MLSERFRGLSHIVACALVALALLVAPGASRAQVVEDLTQDTQLQEQRRMDELKDRLRSLYAEGRYRDAIEAAKAILELEPNSPSAIFFKTEAERRIQEGRTAPPLRTPLPSPTRTPIPTPTYAPPPVIYPKSGLAALTQNKVVLVILIAVGVLVVVASVLGFILMRRARARDEEETSVSDQPTVRGISDLPTQAQPLKGADAPTVPEPVARINVVDDEPIAQGASTAQIAAAPIAATAANEREPEPARPIEPESIPSAINIGNLERGHSKEFKIGEFSSQADMADSQVSDVQATGGGYSVEAGAAPMTPLPTVTPLPTRAGASSPTVVTPAFAGPASPPAMAPRTEQFAVPPTAQSFAGPPPSFAGGINTPAPAPPSGFAPGGLASPVPAAPGGFAAMPPAPADPAAAGFAAYTPVPVPTGFATPAQGVVPGQAPPDGDLSFNSLMFGGAPPAQPGGPPSSAAVQIAGDDMTRTSFNLQFEQLMLAPGAAQTGPAAAQPPAPPAPSDMERTVAAALGATEDEDINTIVVQGTSAAAPAESGEGAQSAEEATVQLGAGPKKPAAPAAGAPSTGTGGSMFDRQFDAGKTAFNSGDFAKAVQCLSVAASLRPGDQEVRQLLEEARRRRKS